MSDGPEESGDEKSMPTAHPWSPRPRRKPPSETGFDSWLNRSLQVAYGSVAQEPVPPELLDLIRRNTQSN